MRRLASRFLLTGLLIAAASAMPQSAKAAQSITITPTSLDKTINPGDTLSGTVQVLNQADSAFDYKVYAAPYSVTGEDYDPSFTSIPGAADVASWFRLKATKNHLEPYTVSDLKYSITVPKDTKPGGYYAVIFAETESKSEVSGVTTQKRVGTVVYIKVAGQITEAGEIASWQVNWLQEPPLTQTLRISNNGSVHFAATVSTTVQDLFGDPKLRYTQKRNILPEKTRRIPIVWEKTPQLGVFKVSGTVSFLGQTTRLPTKYVLVISQPIRRGCLIVLVLASLLYIIRNWRARRKRAKHEPSK